MNALDVPISELTEEITLRVRITGYRGWRVRLACAVWLIRLATRVAGMGIEVQE